jgi:hypothetical protein
MPVHYPPYPAPNPIGVRVTLENDNCIDTRINCTLEEAREYYLGNPAAVPPGDVPQVYQGSKCVAVELLEEQEECTKSY